MLSDNTTPGTYLDTAVPGATLLSPSDGTVVSYRVAGDQGTNFGIAVVRSAGAAGYSAVAASPLAPLAVAGTSPSIPVSLPIKVGESVAMNIGDGLGGPGFGAYRYVNTPGASHRYIIPPLTPGGAPANGATSPDAYVVYNAAVRYCVVPDLKGKKLGQARSALAAADCTVGSIRPAKKKKRKHKVVVSQGVAAGTSVSDTAPIDLRLGKRKKK
jgi:hypothetical protein